MWIHYYVMSFVTNVDTLLCNTFCNKCGYTAACPQVFSSGGTCTLLPSLLGVHPNFWGCNVPSNSSFGGYKENELHFSHFTCPVFVYVGFFKHMK
jgi:hypothetical protein